MSSVNEPNYNSYLVDALLDIVKQVLVHSVQNRSDRESIVVCESVNNVNVMGLVEKWP